MSSLSSCRNDPIRLFDYRKIADEHLHHVGHGAFDFLQQALSRQARQRKESQGSRFGDTAMTAMFIGLVSAYIGSYIGGFVSGGGLFSFSGSFMPPDSRVRFRTGDGRDSLYLSEKKNLAWVEKPLDRRKHAYRHGQRRSWSSCLCKEAHK